MNLDRAGLQFDGFAVPRQVIGAFALDLDRRVLRRDLLDQAGEAWQQGPDGVLEVRTRIENLSAEPIRLIRVELKQSPAMNGQVKE